MAEYPQYTKGYDMQHEDFDVHSKEYSIFRVQDYNWKEHGFEVFRRFLPMAAAPLDEEFDHIYNLTYNRSDMIIYITDFFQSLWCTEIH
jgi:hypothetical protein